MPGLRFYDGQDAADVLGWAHMDFGLHPGGFKVKLLDALTFADDEHRALIGLGFPGLVTAYEVYSRRPGGIAELQAAAQLTFNPAVTSVVVELDDEGEGS